ncbi:MAG TPA: hypothetical protein VKU40_11585 [Thermoanaerobaculia bacterium]|nr:hypothetical protein [Thermoanaerobaculia bacterium]
MASDTRRRRSLRPVAAPPGRPHPPAARFLRLLAVFLLPLLACTGHSTHEAADGAALVADGEVRLRGLRNPISVAVAADGTLFAADLTDGHLKSFAADGSERFSVGGFGEAPGRFRIPVSVALDGGGRLAVGDANGRISLWSRAGEWLDSFIVADVVHFSSDLAFEGGDRLLVGGLGTSEPVRMLHLHTTGGERLESFYPLSEPAARYEAVAITGARFALAGDGRIFAVQPTALEVTELAADGRVVDVRPLPADGLRSLSSPEPSQAEDRQAWLDSWDPVHRIFRLPDGSLVVSAVVSRGTYRLYLLDEGGGAAVVLPVDLDERPVAVDGAGRLCTVHRDGDDTLLRRYRLRPPA